MATFHPIFYTGILQFFLHTECDEQFDLKHQEQQLQQSRQPVVILASHHITYDMGAVPWATKKQLGITAKSITHPTVYNSSILKAVFGPRRSGILTTSFNKSKKFIDIFNDWIKDKASNEDLSSEPQQALVVAPAGMTTHQNMIAPMYWEYFANPHAKKILANVDSSNPFGLCLRNLSASAGMGEIISLMMPWISFRITFHPHVIPNDGITSQDEVNKLVAKVYKEKHGKEFASGWTQRMRRNIDKYLKHGEFTPWPQPNDDDTLIDKQANHVTYYNDDDEGSRSKSILADHVLNRLPPKTRYVTSSLLNFHDFGEFVEGEKQRKVRISDIAVLNPRTLTDEILACVYNIPMAKIENWHNNDCAHNDETSSLLNS
eukprot:CAMPEP_0118687666 /NCGR_PEP_ID=MMETSP0800-20121206/8507_1 /TAXON_ID=210618 ORGANISM="Striatella unipunctata, Strain CCMP2910" /NCGR_SAMPLE_ID=MMETSP0800 /ASSEMBLY_ACC=CAM_ASM_000638 /LENGTH=374 /DNA_ID=CAMNT_0006584871 /DNA_START=309 /DNA_END=1433 /DNA_ORIENTATION=-